MYDVTCETSFLDVRDWVEAIEVSKSVFVAFFKTQAFECFVIQTLLIFFSFLQESTPKPIPIMLCGNKIDLRESYRDEGKTVITEESGEKLAKVSSSPYPPSPYLTELSSHQEIIQELFFKCYFFWENGTESELNSMTIVFFPCRSMAHCS